MFSFFKKKEKGPEFSDSIWYDKEAMYAGLAGLLKTGAKGTNTFLISHFAKGKEEAFSVLRQKGCQCNILETGGETTPVEAGHTILVGSETFLQSAGLKKKLAESVLKGGKVYILGHHPYLDHDKKLLSGLFEASPEAKPVFMASLDSPLLEKFGSANIRSILDKIGMEKTDPIEHKMISSSIERAQEKIAKYVTAERKAASEKEWMEKNVNDIA